MSDSNSTPYGLKSLLECFSRAAFLAQPDDIPGFLCAHVKNMITSSAEESRDIKDVAFGYQCQWEQTFFKDKRNWTETPKLSSEEFPTPTSSESSSSSVSPVASSPFEGSESSVRIPSQHESEDANSVKPGGVSSERISSQLETEPSLPSAWPVVPPICQKPSKQVQGRKSTKERICRLIDCPYHNKDTESSPADQSLGPVSTSTGPTVKKDLGLRKSKAKRGPSEIPVPYRPKGGYIVDPELEPKKARARPLTNRMSAVESALLFGRQGTAYGMQGNVLEGINLSQVSVETTPYTCSHSKRNVLIFSYRVWHVQRSQVQPHSGRLQHQHVAKSGTPSDPATKTSSALSKSPDLFVSYWNNPELSLGTDQSQKNVSSSFSFSVD